MTNKTEKAPERIFTSSSFACCRWAGIEGVGDITYVRADLYNAVVAERDATIKELAELHRRLHKIDSDTDIESDHMCPVDDKLVAALADVAGLRELAKRLVTRCRELGRNVHHEDTLDQDTCDACKKAGVI